MDIRIAEQKDLPDIVNIYNQAVAVGHVQQTLNR